MIRFAYDDAFDPPAPIVPIHVSAPGDTGGLMIPAIIDTGADCSLIPAHLVSSARLPALAPCSFPESTEQLRLLPFTRLQWTWEAIERLRASWRSARKRSWGEIS